MPRYIVTFANGIFVDGDFHQDGTELRSQSAGTIKAMLRVGHIRPMTAEELEADAKAKAAAAESKPKKADK